ncbi:MAG: HdeD family acid-resistance protein [Pseudomonadota bacterium]|nr:HdeD family acid-resistance protein [Pseudomonadota bacterium]
MSTKTPDLAPMRAAMTKSLHTHWRFFMIEGSILLLLGLAAVVIPAIATVAVETIVGWLLLISGMVGLIATFTMLRAPGFWWSLLSAFAGIMAGVVLLRWPLSGAVSLTVILTVFMLAEGVVSILFSLDHRRDFSGRWSIMMMSGVVDIILAGIIFAGLPGTAAWAIGVLLGVNLIFGGSALLSMALYARTAASSPAGQETA